MKCPSAGYSGKGITFDHTAYITIYNRLIVPCYDNGRVISKVVGHENDKAHAWLNHEQLQQLIADHKITLVD